MLSKNKSITLIFEQTDQDSDGFSVVNESLAQVWAHIDSVTGSEYSAAGQLSIRPAFRAVIWLFEYNDQKLVELDGKRYAVYRTYQRNADEIDLYLEEKAGVNK